MPVAPHRRIEISIRDSKSQKRRRHLAPRPMSSAVDKKLLKDAKKAARTEALLEKKAAREKELAGDVVEVHSRSAPRHPLSLSSQPQSISSIISSIPYLRIRLPHRRVVASVVPPHVQQVSVTARAGRILRTAAVRVALAGVVGVTRPLGGVGACPSAANPPAVHR
jgi:hypothetical protein